MKITTQDWFNYAKTDLRSCENNLHDDFVTNVVAFHAQQTVEKSFKALIEEKGLTIPRVHSLQRLYDIVKQFIDNVIDIKQLALLDSVYTSSRYPGNVGILSTGKPTIQEANELYESAKNIYEIVLKTIADSE